MLWVTLSDLKGLLGYAPAFYGAWSAIDGMPGMLLVSPAQPNTHMTHKA